MEEHTTDTYDLWRQNRLRIDDWDESFRSGRWDYLNGIGELPRYAMIAGYVHKLIPGGTILDAGCGEGILGDYLDLERFEYVGFDVARTAVGRARERLRRGTVEQASVEEFVPPAGARYEAVVFNEVLQSTSTPFESLDRYRGFVGDHGIIALSIFKNPNPNANGPPLARLLLEQCEAGRYSLIDRAEALSVSHDLAWQIFILR